MANLKLHQLIAMEKTFRSDGERLITNAYHLIQKPDLMAGLTKTYAPSVDGEPGLPGESIKVQTITEDVLTGVTKAMVRLFDFTATKDNANQVAAADLVVDGVVLATNLPVSTLLFLEKKLVDLTTFVGKLPTLDPAQDWTSAEIPGVYKAADKLTSRAKKIPRNHVKAPATDKHPAQVEVYYEDAIVGTWTTRIFSGAIPASRKATLLARLHKLSMATKAAREQANQVEVADRKFGDALMGWLLA